MSDWIILSLSVFMAALIPDSAIGAGVGSLYFLLSAKDETGLRKALLCLVGFVAGYAISKPFQDGHWTMVIAILGSAFATSIMLQFTESFSSKEGTAPPFLGWVIELYHKIRGR